MDILGLSVCSNKAGVLVFTHKRLECLRIYDIVTDRVKKYEY